MAAIEWHRDCREFPGTHACDIMTAEGYESCAPCKFYDPIKKKILILKLGALGDVLRTTALLPAIKEKYGPATKITWVVREEGKELLKDNQHIDNILPYSQETVLRLQQEKFDVLFSLEVGPPATNLANLINSKEKYGFYVADDGHPAAFTKDAESYLNTVFSNAINHATKKTYQEMMATVCNLHYKNNPYTLSLTKEEQAYAKNFLNAKCTKGKKLLGITVGAGGRWQSKAWHPSRIIEFIEMVKAKTDDEIILLGGEKESVVMQKIIEQLKKKQITVLHNESTNTLRQFAAIINCCDRIITNDTLALHLAIALNKKTIALFFCTPWWQIETFNGLATPRISPLVEKHFMDDRYDEQLMKSISANEVFEKL